MDAPVTSLARLTPAERRAALGAVAPGQQQAGWPVLSEPAAERMVENVVGVFGLPQAVAVHLLVDGQRYQVPMAIEEASVVAALSASAKLAARAGGFKTSLPESLLTCQIYLSGVAAPKPAAAALMAASAQWLARANAACPRLCARGGGVREMAAEGKTAEGAVLVHLLVDTCDAMGANVVNSLGEQLSAALVAACGGTASVSILSNLTERSVARANIVLPTQLLATAERSGEAVRDSVLRVMEFAEASVHRAVTHNKGIMNAIDAIAVATGNDWRAIEANAHAWAGRGAGYRPLSRWWANSAGHLVGDIEVPLKVGTVGGNLAANPGVAANLRLLAVRSAGALARLMAAAGLAQNFAALRALGTDGIQRGHMRLHARSVVASAGISPSDSDAIVAAMLAEGTVTVSRATELFAQAKQNERGDAAAKPAASRRPLSPQASAAAFVGKSTGKMLLFGEHAVVYGAHAVALPLDLTCEAHVTLRAAGGVHLSIPHWHIDETLAGTPALGGVHHSLSLLLGKLGLLRKSLHLLVLPNVPRGVGLGSSAALAVAVIRALDAAFGLRLDAPAIAALAFEAEKVAHATPSGVDNTLATYARPLLFQRGEPPLMQPLVIARPFVVVVGLSHEHSSTAAMVRKVRAATEAAPAFCQGLFTQIDGLACQGAEALRTGDLQLLGQLMNLNHGLLHALHLSTAGVEDIVHRARAAGALGVKMTGGGGGGAVLALCKGDAEGQAVAAALRAAHYRAFVCQVAATAADSHQVEVQDVG